MTEEILYQCDLCGKTFTHRPNYWTHINKKKTACIPQEECVKLSLESKMDKSKLNFYEKKLKELEDDKRKQEEKINKLETIVGSIETVKDEIRKVDNRLIEYNDHMENKLTPFTSAYNNCTINNNLSNTNNNFNVQLSQPMKDTMKHISKEEMLWILNRDNLTESVGEFMASMYMNPKAPENMHWCVTDLKAFLGALEYNYTSNTVTRNSTTAVITKNLQAALAGMSGVLEELRQTASFNDRQGKNYSGYYNMVGSQTFHQDYIDIIKEKAYASRNLAKVLWEHLNIAVEKTDINPKISLKTI